MKEFTIKIRKRAVDPFGARMIELADGLSHGDHVRVKSIIGETPVQGRYPVYADEVSADSMYGVIESLFYNGDAVEKEEIPDIIGSEYQIRITRRTGNILEGVLTVTEEEVSASSATPKEIKDAMKSVIDLGIMNEDEITERVEIMKKNGVDIDLMLRVISGYRKYNKPLHKPGCIYVDPNLAKTQKAHVEGIIAEGLRAAVERTAVICEGEKSVGKNVYVETIAYLMGMPLYLITFSRQMSPSSIYGEKTTDNSAAEILEDFDADWLKEAQMIRDKRQIEGIADMLSGKEKMRPYTKREIAVFEEEANFKKLNAMAQSVHIKIDQSELYDWLIDGGLMVFNEMNMAEANFLASFANQLLDGTGFLFIPGRGEVKIHPDCMLFGTQNADYQGVEQQNEATMSRFGCIEFPQPDNIRAQVVAATESALRKCHFKGKPLDTENYSKTQQFYKQCLAAVRKGQVSNACLNIRGFVRALTTVAKSNGKATLKRQIEIHVIGTCPFDERDALKSILSAVCG